MKQQNNMQDSFNTLPERVLQFGEGNFLRAFIDWMIHRMNKAGEFNGSAVVVQPLENGLVDILNEQNGLYTLYLRVACTESRPERMGLKITGEVKDFAEKDVRQSSCNGLIVIENNGV